MLNKNTRVVLCVNSISTLKKDLIDIDKFKNIIVAYEPDEYIGTNNIISEDAIRNFILEARIITNNESKIVYGGGVNINNIRILKEIDELSGIMIGKACANINSFIDIINAY